MSDCFVFDIRRFSINDGPGIRTSVFFKGCPLSCWWCHNPESQSFEAELFVKESECAKCGICNEVCLRGAISLNGTTATNRTLCAGCGECEKVCPSRSREIAGRRVGLNALLADIERDSPFYSESGGGVTFTGGEPLAQPKILIEALEACKKRGLHTAVDTSGHAHRDIFLKVAKLTDLFLYDLKLIDSQAHKEHTGVDNTLILENLRLLSRLGTPIIIRIPVIPQVNDSKDNVVKTGEFLRSLGVPLSIELLPFHRSATAKYKRLGKTPNQKWHTQVNASINKMSQILRIMGLKVILRESKTS